MQPILAKILVFCINVSLWSAGILLIVFGSIALADPQMIIDILNLIDGVQNLTTILDIYGYLMGVAIFMVVLGSFLFLFGFVGCGAANPAGKDMSKRPMMSYSLLLIISMLIEVALIIYAAVILSYQKDDIRKELTTSLHTHFEPVTINQITGVITYSTPKPEAAAWQYLQVQTACCGGDDPSDYNTTFTINYTPDPSSPYTSAIPPTCCSVVSGFRLGDIPVYLTDLQYQTCLQNPLINAVTYSKQGCDEAAFDMFYNFYLIAIIISSCIFVAQLLGLLLTIRIWSKL